LGEKEKEKERGRERDTCFPSASLSAALYSQNDSEFKRYVRMGR
jgi:hypothetical protein